MVALFFFLWAINYAFYFGENVLIFLMFRFIILPILSHNFWPYLFSAEKKSRARPHSTSGFASPPCALSAKFSWSLSGSCVSCWTGDQHLQVPWRPWASHFSHNGKVMQIAFYTVHNRIKFSKLPLGFDTRTALRDVRFPLSLSPGGRGKPTVEAQMRYY